MRIVFFGTSSFASFILKDLLVNQGEQVVAVVTRPDRPQGRKLQVSYSPVKECALELRPDLPLLQPEKSSHPDFAKLLQEFHADLFVVVAYGEIIKSNLLSMPKIGCINIHASLLPSFRGAAPMQRALLAGVQETGITIIQMTPEMDAGAMLVQKSLPVSSDMTLGELEGSMQLLAAELLKQALLKIRLEGKVQGEAQDVSLVTFAPKLKPEEEKINWSLSAQEVHNQIRALSPLPGAWFALEVAGQVKRLKIKKARLEPFLEASPGSFIQFSPKQGWVIACAQGAVRLLEVQLEGKRVMSVEECLRGLPQDGSVKVQY